MKHHFLKILALCACLAAPLSAPAQELFELSAEDAAAAAADYQKYCALCHGADREGYANDYAPSLRSKSLMRSGFPLNLTFAIAYGRAGTPMGGYFEEIGGPMNRAELYRLTRWLSDQVDVEPLDLPLDPVEGDIELGRRIYAGHCAVCHGENGEGALGPAIGNPAMLALTTDAFLRYAIENGRDGTEMQAFGGVLSAQEIDAVTAYLRSRAAGWEVEKPVVREPPRVDEYVLNPDGRDPDFTLEQELFVKARNLHQALQDRRRMVLLDTRVTSMWQMGHIDGAVPMPYYYDNADILARDLPRDGTWIVAYCECPRAAAVSVARKLQAIGFEHVAVLWEGIQGWVALGYPVSVGQRTVAPKLAE
jgi:mono/diheme cytochrome c family protein/rhodanese-related sulfurtransferase